MSKYLENIDHKWEDEDAKALYMAHGILDNLRKEIWEGEVVGKKGPDRRNSDRVVNILDMAASILHERAMRLEFPKYA